MSTDNTPERLEDKGCILQIKYEPMKAAHAREASQARILLRDFALYSRMDARFWEYFFATVVRHPAVISYVAIDPQNNTLVRLALLRLTLALRSHTDP